MFSWSCLPRPIVALAPMAGYTDSPYRRVVKELVPEVICFTEFTSVDGIVHGNEATMRQVTFGAETERPFIAQIFGKKPENFVKAAKILTSCGVDAIDINMGCPAKKIISSDHGSALLKNPCLSEEIVRATVEATPLPVSVKMRIGTSCYDPDHFLKFGQTMARAGAKLITVHGRTSTQMYSGTADWNPIYELKKIVAVPVIGNGDIKSPADALQKIGNLDGVMVGRGTFGNPWVLAEIAAAFKMREQTKILRQAAVPARVTDASGPQDDTASHLSQEKLSVMLRHLALSMEFKGKKWGIMEMRKHFAWYLRGFPYASTIRQQLMKVESYEEVISLLQQATFPVAEAVPTPPQALLV